MSKVIEFPHNKNFRIVDKKVDKVIDQIISDLIIEIVPYWVANDHSFAKLDRLVVEVRKTAEESLKGSHAESELDEIRRSLKYFWKEILSNLS